MKGEYNILNSESFDTTDDDRFSGKLYLLILIIDNLPFINVVPKQSSYSKFRYQGNVYSVGDTVMLSDGENGFYIAKITKLILQSGIAAYKKWPTIQVQWYYRKKDIYLPSMSETYRDGLSDNEVFVSDHFENIIIESILSKCSVISIEKYDQGNNDEKTFFTRATYSQKKVNSFKLILNRRG